MTHFSSYIPDILRPKLEENSLLALAQTKEKFDAATEVLAKETKWNKRMPWVVVALEITFIAAIVLAFAFGGPCGLIPLLFYLPFDTTLGYLSTQHLDPILGYVGTPGPNFVPLAGAIRYISYLTERQSKLEGRCQNLLEELSKEGHRGVSRKKRNFLNRSHV